MNDDNLPAILFDSYAVYQALDEQAKSRTCPENVADVLDAVVRAMKAQRNEENPPAPVKGASRRAGCFLSAELK